MTHDPYGDADLVTLYDVDNPGGVDHAWYRALAGEVAATTILDLGCGTGLLTRSLATPGRRVTGIDPSPTMLAFARAQPGAEAVTWVLGDAAAIAPGAGIDLVVCTGNAIMHLGPDAFGADAARVAAGLRRGGTLAFETRNPGSREWEGWTPEATTGERDTALGRIREWLEVTHVDPETGLVRFDAHNLVLTGASAGQDRVFTSDLWFRSEQQVRAALVRAGFVEVRIDGGWQQQPVTDSSRVLVVRATTGA